MIRFADRIAADAAAPNKGRSSPAPDATDVEKSRADRFLTDCDCLL